MKAVKWFSRIGVAILFLSILQDAKAGIIGTILWFTLWYFNYLFFIEYWYLSAASGKRSGTWFITAHRFYVESKLDIPYWKFMWQSFLLMLQDDYED